MTQRTSFGLVSLAKIHPHPDNIRKAIPRDEAFTALADSIEAHGLRQPLLLTDHPNHKGEYLLLAGHRRLEALKDRGAVNAPAMIREGIHTATEQVAVMLQENTMRTDLTKAEEADAVDLLTEAGMTAAQIRDLVGHSETWVRTRQKVRNAPEHTREALAAGDATLERVLEVVAAEAVHPDDGRILDAAVAESPQLWEMAKRRVENLRAWRAELPEWRAACETAGLRIVDDFTVANGGVKTPAGMVTAHGYVGGVWLHDITPEDTDKLKKMAAAGAAVILTAVPEAHGHSMGPHWFEPARQTPLPKVGEGEPDVEKVAPLVDALHEAKAALKSAEDAVRMGLTVRGELIRQRMARRFTIEQGREAIGLALAHQLRTLHQHHEKTRVELWQAATGQALKTFEELEAWIWEQDANTHAVVLMNALLISPTMHTQDVAPEDMGVTLWELTHQGPESTSALILWGLEDVFGDELRPDSTLMDAPSVLRAADEAVEDAVEALRLDALEAGYRNTHEAEKAVKEARESTAE